MKITHKYTGTADGSSAALSILLDGTSAGTASQGIFIDSTSDQATSGNLLTLRNNGVNQLTLGPTGITYIAGSIELGHASDTTISRASAGVIAVEGVNLLRVGDVTTNATHTGEVTGATTLTVDKTAITGKTAVTADAADYVLISDTSDTGNLKKALVSDFGGGTGNVTKVGTPADNQIGVWTGDGTIEGTTGLTYDGTTLESTRIDVGATGSILSIYHDSSSPAVADIVGIIQFNGRDSAANKQEYGRILVDIQSPTSTAEGGNMYFDLFSNGTSVRQLELLRNSTLRPGANDLIALGGVAQGFSDLHLATGGVINWASNATITHSTGLLTSNVPISLGTSNALTAGTIELGHASDTTISRSAAGVIAVEGVVIPSISSTNTFTNKRITHRHVTATSYTTSTTIDSDAVDIYTITAQAGALLFNNPTGTPTEGQNLIIRIKDNGTARALTWGANFRAMGNALPSTTVLSKTMYLGFKYNTEATTVTKWDLIALANEA